MLTRFALALALAGCGAPAAMIPDDLRTCPGAAAYPADLPRLVTPQALRVHDKAETAARRGTEAALIACAAKLAAVVELADRRGR